ncbi:mCG1051106 [Mus musculus]|nr:mCG1051106 [Mus musculus]
MNTDLEVLYCMCVEGLISAGVCCLFGDPVFERSRGSRLIETAGPPTGPQLLSAFPNSTTGISCFCLLVGCKYLHLALSAACWVFWSVVMQGPSFCERSIASVIVSDPGTSF